MARRILFFFLLTFFAGAMELALTEVRSDLGLSYSLITGFCLLLAASVTLSAKSKILKTHHINLALLLGISIVHLPPRLISFNETVISLPDYAGHMLGIATAWMFSKIKGRARWAILFSGMLVALFMFFTGYDLFLHRLNFGTYTGRYDQKMPEFSAYDSTGALIGNGQLRGKFTLIDLWHTRCGACFKKFPLLERNYLELKDAGNIAIVALNVPLSSDRRTQAFEMISKRGYTFPVAKLATMGLLDSIQIGSFPTTLVIDQAGKIIFKGELEKGISRLKKIIQ